MPPFAAASRRAPRLAPAASSGTSLALPATACTVPLALPERTGRIAQRVSLHHTASEPIGRNSPPTGLLVCIDQRNPYSLSGFAHRRVTRQGYPCAASAGLVQSFFALGF